MFDIHYKKNDNQALLKCFEENNFFKVQNYIPLYKNFFSLDENNFNNINLNHKNHILSFKKTDMNNVFDSYILNNKCKLKKLSFFKLSPLIDPVKFMIGKFKNVNNDTILKLPDLNNKTLERIQDVNNASYVDSFFSYLTSMLLNTYNIPHCIDFYGSFLTIKKNLKVNIVDDIDYLYDSTFFHKNKNSLFNVENIDLALLNNEDTRKYKKKLNIADIKTNDLIIDELNNEELDQVFKKNNDVDILTKNNLHIHNSLIFESSNSNKESSKQTNSRCSSRTSRTTENSSNNSIDDDESSEEESENSCELSEMTIDTDIELNATFQNFPVQVICLEKMDNTLDSLMDDDFSITKNEWKSILFQVIMTLIIYQKAFDFTHNDLHTNNIMYVETDKKYLYYKFNNSYYKVPTYGKLYKIIDFGRSIYKFRNKIFCSDSYSKKGDASSQYNCEPYFNKNKPRLEPNKSFDLSRLGCSLFDYFFEDIDDYDSINDPVSKLIIEWCTDDNGRNILYKKNGDERYPDFKLYKMIARTVHNHTPQSQLNKDIFNKFQTTGRQIKSKKSKIINIDKLPSYVTFKNENTAIKKAQGEY
tara:strand:- start:24 stop:1784 length:1761 start_codon:yes stop_codon:yes gene_type:complete